jgi:acyl-CoA thioester hydrolase
VSDAFTHRLRVRYSECDPQGVVFNAHYVTYFDIALTELWREAIGPYADMVEAGADMVVAEARVRYLAPAGFDEVLEIAVVPTRLGTTGMTTTMRVDRDGTLVAEGDMRHVFVDTATGTKRPIPDDVRRGLEPYLRRGDALDGARPAERPAEPERPAMAAAAATTASESIPAPTAPGPDPPRAPAR